MKISVIGAGYVGLISAVGWAGRGHEVSCIDVDKAKVAKISQGLPPIYEENLSGRLRGALKAGKLRAESDYSSIADADIVFIAVGTPSAPDGSADLSYVRSAAEAIVREIRGRKTFLVVAVRSTVSPGTTSKVVGGEFAKAGRAIGYDYGLAMVPEFLKEGTALADFDEPDRVVAGVSDEKTKAVMEELYSSFKCPKLFTDLKTAEMIKYASNSFLAVRVSLVNEFALMCEALGMDIDDVMKGVGMDRRIGPQFLVAGAGFGGSCFPKDVRAIVPRAKEASIEPLILEAALAVNAKQQLRLLNLLHKHMALKGKTVAVLGLAFKVGTDDVRESPSLALVKALLDAGCSVRAYDPKAMENTKKVFPPARFGIHYAKDWEDCLRGADAAMLVTAWPEFDRPASEYKKALGEAPLYDARRILKQDEANKEGLNYHCIGRGR